MDAEENISSLSPSIGSDVSLVLEGSKEALLDISKSPLLDFHNSERSQHGVSNQVGDIHTTIISGGCFLCWHHFHHYHYHLGHQQLL